MSTGTKIGVFFGSIFLLTIFKQFIPFNIAYIGAFIIYILYQIPNTDRGKEIQKEVIAESLHEPAGKRKMVGGEYRNPIERNFSRAKQIIASIAISNPFRKLPLGYYRLYIAGWLFIPTANAILAWTITFFFERNRYYNDCSDNAWAWFVITLIAYYPVMRICLWIWDGFQQDNDHRKGG
jgi:hypothetical protein